MLLNQNQVIHSRYETLVEMCIALSAESNPERLLERILICAKTLAFADGGSIYFIDEKSATIKIMHNDTLNIRLGGTALQSPQIPPIPLYTVEGTPNFRHVVSYAVHHGSTVNVRDSYSRVDGFDFSGTAEFDQRSGYRSVSFLTVPLKNHENTIIGVLQLINAIDTVTRRIVSFDDVTERLVEALASQAAIALTKESLISDVKNLFDALTRLIANAIDRKSPYTGGHCRRLPDITMRLAEAAHRVDYGPLKNFTMTEEDHYELEIASWLHDCGKIATPEHIMDKATKLETRFDRIDLLEARYEMLHRDAKIAYLEGGIMPGLTQPFHDEEEYRTFCCQLKKELAFLRHCNTGSESMSSEDKGEVLKIGSRPLYFSGELRTLLTDEEIENLCVSRGTLTEHERKIINDHILVTIEMLESLPFPKHLQNVVEYAGGHHERMDGKGYPKGLCREQMSVQARIMGIADIFEALTASDRPYKHGKTLSESLGIMAKMKRSGHIDPDLFDVFIKEKVYISYAESYLHPSQIDDVDESSLLL